MTHRVILSSQLQPWLSRTKGIVQKRPMNRQKGPVWIRLFWQIQIEKRRVAFTGNCGHDSVWEGLLCRRDLYIRERDLCEYVSFDKFELRKDLSHSQVIAAMTRHERTAQKRRIHTQKRPIHTQKRRIHTPKRPIYMYKRHVRTEKGHMAEKRDNYLVSFISFTGNCGDDSARQRRWGKRGL